MNGFLVLLEIHLHGMAGRTKFQFIGIGKPHVEKAREYHACKKYDYSQTKAYTLRHSIPPLISLVSNIKCLQANLPADQDSHDLSCGSSRAVRNR